MYTYKVLALWICHNGNMEIYFGHGKVIEKSWNFDISKKSWKSHGFFYYL